ncbi:FKBP12-associated protein 1 [Aspergillus udagawae]|nr:FKBP12-associated protein 1 [Aspergillus udagawae]
MSGSPVATADNNTPRPKAARRRGRGRGGRDSLRSIQAAPNTQPEAQETPQVPANEASSLNVQPNESSRAARGSRGGNRGGRGVGASQDNGRRRERGRGEDTKALGGGLGGRTFEGRLSKPHRPSDEDQPDDTGDLSLRADAPEFVPGAPTNGVVPTRLTSSADSTTGKGKSKNVQPRPPKVTTKSTAPDIATRIHEDIAHNLYECPICTSELGRRSRVWSLHRVPGAALAVIFHTRSSLPPIPVGVRRKSTPVRYLASPHTRAVKPAHGHAKAVRIRAMRLATLVLVHLVPRWAQLKIVSVGGIRRLSAARIQITRMVGAVGRYAVTCSPAANTLVLGRAMRASVGHVRSK